MICGRWVVGERKRKLGVQNAKKGGGPVCGSHVHVHARLLCKQSNVHAQNSVVYLCVPCVSVHACHACIRVRACVPCGTYVGRCVGRVERVEVCEVALGVHDSLARQAVRGAVQVDSKHLYASTHTHARTQGEKKKKKKAKTMEDGNK